MDTASASSRTASRKRYDSAPTHLLPKVELPETQGSGWVTLLLHVAMSVLVLLVTLCLLPLLLPVSLVFRLYRSVLTAQINKRHGRAAVVMPGTDALWLQDTPTNMAVITTVMMMRGTMDVPGLRALIKRRMIDIYDPNNPTEKWFPKATQYPTQILHRYTWLDEEDFDIEEHVIEYHRSMPDNQQELEVMIGELASTPLRPCKSPWQLVLIPPHGKHPDRYVAVFRVHHAIADGVSLVQLLLKQFIDEPPQVNPKRSFGSKAKRRKIFKAIFEGPLMVIQRFLFPADQNILHGSELNGHKVVSWSDAIDIMLIKKIKNVTGTTVNDVLIACLGASIRAYIKRHGTRCPQDVLSYVPVNLRKPSDKVVLDNQFVLVFLRMPTHTDDPLEQLAHTAERMNQIKVSPEPIINSLIMRYCMARLPNWMTRMTFDMFARKCTLIVSNVPGPQDQMSMNGQLIEDIIFWPPTRANVGLGVSILSYAGHVRVGVMCDKALLSHPRVLVDDFVQQVHHLAGRVNVDKVE